jgi:hypothetical protein
VFLLFSLAQLPFGTKAYKAPSTRQGWRYVGCRDQYLLREKDVASAIDVVRASASADALFLLTRRREMWNMQIELLIGAV